MRAKIIATSIAFVIGLCVFFYFAFLYRKEWTSKVMKVNKVECSPKKEHYCNNFSKVCRKNRAYTRECEILLDDSNFPPIKQTFDSRSTAHLSVPPDVKDSILVYYDTNDLQSASLLSTEFIRHLSLIAASFVCIVSFVVMTADHRSRHQTRTEAFVGKFAP